MEKAVHDALLNDKVVQDTLHLAHTHGMDHNALVGVCASLAANQFITTQKLETQALRLTAEGEACAQLGAPEARIYNAVDPQDGSPLDSLSETLGAALAKIGVAKAMERKWLQVVKEPLDPAAAAAAAAAAESAAAAEGGKKAKKPELKRRVLRVATDIDDAVQRQLLSVRDGAPLPKEDVALLKKRQLVELVTTKSLRLARGPHFDRFGQKPAADLTHEMLVKGSYKEAVFKPVNVAAGGLPPSGGALHPLLTVRSMFRETFLEMGFEEMETAKLVESSFWNFDALFQPQQHPARDAHDTFFVSQPAATLDIPAEYMQRVKQTHEVGGAGLADEYNANSHGWRYDWSEDEARKNLLRTHTTAASSRALYKIAQLARDKGEPFKPGKYFSIDRVFRNESLDATHLAEFHQVEGFVIDRNLSLGNLMGIIADFYRRLGPEFKDMKFKPTYNPYTEPSMEFHCYHEGLGKWVEVGNSGVFRPEMLRPMGFDEDVTVVAWGMSLERPTMIKYGFDNIRDLFGHKVDLSMVREHPMVRWA